MALFLQDIAGTIITITPETNLKDSGKKVESRHRTRDGSEFVYKWGNFDLIDLEVMYVNSSFKTIVNSWWHSNNDLTFYSDGELPWDINDVIYNNKSYDVSSAEKLEGFFFKPDGTKFYTASQVSFDPDVYQYSTLTPWNVESASFDKIYDTGLTMSAPRGLFFKPDGLRFYLVGVTPDKIFQYHNLTAWEIDSASNPTDKDFNLSEVDSAQAVSFKDDGSKFYVLDIDKLYQYSTTEDWDVEFSSYDNKSFDFSAQENFGRGLFFKSGGSKFFIVGSNSTVCEYAALTAWDIESATFTGNTFVGSEDNEFTDIFFKPDGTNMYLLGTQNDSVYQYAFSTDIKQVHIINKTKPIDKFNKPYDDLFQGVIKLGTF